MGLALDLIETEGQEHDRAGGRLFKEAVQGQAINLIISNMILNGINGINGIDANEC